MPTTAQKYGDMFLKSSHKYAQSMNVSADPTDTMKQKTAMLKGVISHKAGLRSVLVSMVLGAGAVKPGSSRASNPWPHASDRLARRQVKE